MAATPPHESIPNSTSRTERGGGPTSPTEVELACRGLFKSYGAQQVLNGVDLTIHPGRVYALLGRNGAGKSTIVKIMLGLIRPDAGQTYLLGRLFERASLEAVGASIDGPAIYGHLSARENLLVHARLTATSSQQVEEVLALVSLSETGRKRSKNFSTGMKARLALATALLTDPRILVLDEPQNGLDPEGIIELRSLLRDLAQRGRTVLISSHQLGEVRQLADDIGILASGRIVYEGPLTHLAPDGQLEEAYLRATTEAPK